MTRSGGGLVFGVTRSVNTQDSARQPSKERRAELHGHYAVVQKILHGHTSVVQVATGGVVLGERHLWLEQTWTTRRR
jgi:hypothetical protein